MHNPLIVWKRLMVSRPTSRLAMMPLQPSEQKEDGSGRDFGTLSVTKTPIHRHEKSNFAADYFGQKAFHARATDRRATVLGIATADLGLIDISCEDAHLAHL